MAQLETTTWQYLRCPLGFFYDAWEGFFFFFFNIQKEIVKNGA